jgi:lysozyme
MNTDLKKAINIIKSFEGIEDGDPTTVNLDPYLCPANYWTIAWGHLVLDASGNKLKGLDSKKEAYAIYPNGVTLQEAEILLQDDVRKFSAGVLKLVKHPINNNQFSSLVSFVFNLGINSLKISTLLKKLNKGDIEGAADQFIVWNKIRVDGVLVISNGLVRRRKMERDLFLSID